MTVYYYNFVLSFMNKTIIVIWKCLFLNLRINQKNYHLMFVYITRVICICNLHHVMYVYFAVFINNVKVDWGQIIMSPNIHKSTNRNITRCTPVHLPYRFLACHVVLQFSSPHWSSRLCWYVYKLFLKKYQRRRN